VSLHPVKTSKRVAAMAGEPFPERPRASERWRALLGIAASGVLAAIGIAQVAGLPILSPYALFGIGLVVWQLQWANLTLARTESAFRRNGRPLRREPPAPGQRALSPHTRGRLVYVLEAFAAVMTSIGTLLVGAHMMTPQPHPITYVACAAFLAVCAIAILFPKMGAR
jgi:hypothetical protein